MTYQQPKLVQLGSAVEAIQGGVGKNDQPIESGQLPTVDAYAADE